MSTTITHSCNIRIKLLRYSETDKNVFDNHNIKDLLNFGLMESKTNQKKIMTFFIIIYFQRYWQNDLSNFLNIIYIRKLAVYKRNAHKQTFHFMEEKTKYLVIFEVLISYRGFEISPL